MASRASKILLRVILARMQRTLVKDISQKSKMAFDRNEAPMTKSAIYD